MPENQCDFDAIIIGARVAGSIVGSLLGDKGFEVLALDQARFPSDTIPHISSALLLFAPLMQSA